MTELHAVFTIHVNASKGIAHLQQIQEWLAVVKKDKARWGWSGRKL